MVGTPSVVESGFDEAAEGSIRRQALSRGVLSPRGPAVFRGSQLRGVAGGRVGPAEAEPEATRGLCSEGSSHCGGGHGVGVG